MSVLVLTLIDVFVCGQLSTGKRLPSVFGQLGGRPIHVDCRAGVWVTCPVPPAGSGPVYHVHELRTGALRHRMPPLDAANSSGLGFSSAQLSRDLCSLVVAAARKELTLWNLSRGRMQRQWTLPALEQMW